MMIRAKRYPTEIGEATEDYLNMLCFKQNLLDLKERLGDRKEAEVVDFNLDIYGRDK